MGISLTKFKNLENLNLSGNEFTEDEIMYLLQLIQLNTFPNFKFLNISGSNITKNLCMVIQTLIISKDVKIYVPDNSNIGKYINELNYRSNIHWPIIALGLIGYSNVDLQTILELISLNPRITKLSCSVLYFRD